MAKCRKRYESGFKARVALEALKERDTIAVIAKRFGVHSALIHQWKKRLVEEAGSVFDGAEQRTEEVVSQAELSEQIGRLNVALDWLKKNCQAGHLSFVAGSTRTGRGSASHASASCSDCRGAHTTTRRPRRLKRT